MTTNTLERDCRFCSVISKANGEDPIGSAGTYEHWIIAEIPQPWDDTIWTEHPIVAPASQLIETLTEDQGMQIRPLMIAPDSGTDRFANREYSQPGKTRLLYYHRPATRFAEFEKQEFLLPTAEVLPLITTLLQQPDHLPQFDAYRQPTHHIRELFVCVHGNVDVACSRFGYPIYEQIRKTYVPQSNGNLRVWRCSHFGGHNFAPTLIDLPEGRYWGHLEPEILEALIHRNVPVSQLRPVYRGWAGLGQYEQILERELWMQFGWQWIHFLKAGQTLAIDPDHEEWDADWAEVRLEYASPDGVVQGAYTARIEVSGYVTTQWSSKDKELAQAKQYRVSQLTQVA